MKKGVNNSEIAVATVDKLKTPKEFYKNRRFSSYGHDPKTEHAADILMFILSNDIRKEVYRILLSSPGQTYTITELLAVVNDFFPKERKVESRTIRHHLDVLKSANLVTLEASKNVKGNPVFVKGTKLIKEVSVLYGQEKLRSTYNLVEEKDMSPKDYAENLKRAAKHKS